MAVRLAFIGQRAFFEIDSLEEPADGIEPRFFDFRHGADPRPLRDALDAFDPDVVFVWRPEILPHGFLHASRAARIGYLTEPLPRPGDPNPHSDLTARLGYLELADPANFDRIISFDPLIVPTVERLMPVWRSFPIPVSDRMYVDAVPPANDPPQITFTGRSTEHRESFLGPAKHDFDVIHVVHGFFGSRLVDLLQGSDVLINLHNEPYTTFENRILHAVAAGALVVTEPVSPTNGLTPGADYVEVTTPWELWELLNEISKQPDAFDAMRRSGRREAERFRASRVFPALVRDVLADQAARSVPNASRSS